MLYRARPITAELVADDQVVAERCGATIWLSGPATIRDRIEIRGLGIWAWPAIVGAKLVAVADLVAPAEVERLPTPRTIDILGTPYPLLSLAPFEASASAKLLLWLATLATAHEEQTEI
jgi:serine kinase of HPr protein (carbohydrate metabolism regulator)